MALCTLPVTMLQAPAKEAAEEPAITAAPLEGAAAAEEPLAEEQIKTAATAEPAEGDAGAAAAVEKVRLAATPDIAAGRPERFMLRWQLLQVSYVMWPMRVWPPRVLSAVPCMHAGGRHRGCAPD